MVFENTAIVILGASGDLAKRKLIPALDVIHKRLDHPKSLVVIGSGRSNFTDDEFRARFDISPDFAEHMHFHQGIKGLKQYISQRGSFEKIVFFFSLPPSVYGITAKSLADEGFGDESRLIIEKPFGYDYESSKKLDNELSKYFKDNQIFRIDHYLAKEAVQNILVFRFANSIFSPVWNNNYIESIQINASETLGVEDRAAYFDNSGIIRDMVQNHLMQLLCLMTMEAPVSLDADDIIAQKINILKSIKITDVCRYQYEGYKNEDGVNPNSNTETYAFVKLYINNFRWSGVPIYIRTGKATSRKGTEVGIKFKKPPKLLFNTNNDVPANQVIFKIQPSEGILVDLASKIPGAEIKITSTNMAFCYKDSFSQEIPEAYQRLLLDAIRGDRTLFVSAQETELSWKNLDPFLDSGELKSYKVGEQPDPCWGIDWIPFENYHGMCE